MTPDQYITYLKEEQLYPEAKIIGDRYAAIYPLMYTHAIICGQIGDMCGYDDRWCYHTFDAAKRAYDEWDGTGEPTGWHRHPDTGRRVDENGLMYINP